MSRKRVTIGRKREFEKVPKYGLMDQDKVAWYIENDLDLTEYYEEIEKLAAQRKWSK